MATDREPGSDASATTDLICGDQLLNLIEPLTDDRRSTAALLSTIRTMINTGLYSCCVCYRHT